VKRIQDYPPHFQNVKRGSIGSISFSDAICSGVSGLKMDKLFTPVGGGSYVWRTLPKDNKSKIIIRRLGMNQIQRINIFVQDYKSLNPYLKNILNEVQEDFQKELIKEYLEVSRHPYPNEYLSIT